MKSSSLEREYICRGEEICTGEQSAAAGGGESVESSEMRRDPIFGWVYKSRVRVFSFLFANIWARYLLTNWASARPGWLKPVFPSINFFESYNVNIILVYNISARLLGRSDKSDICIIGNLKCLMIWILLVRSIKIRVIYNYILFYYLSIRIISSIKL